MDNDKISYAVSRIEMVAFVGAAARRQARPVKKKSTTAATTGIRTGDASSVDTPRACAVCKNERNGCDSRNRCDSSRAIESSQSSRFYNRAGSRVMKIHGTDR